MSERRDLVAVVGAGGAGLMAAIFAAGAGARVLLLERTKEGGRKIVMSGGGRCNVLPSVLDPARFVTASSPNTMRKLLLAWPLSEQRRFFEETAGIPLALEAETGKLFPVSNRSRDVRDGLLALAVRRGVETRFGVTLTQAQPADNGGWLLSLEGGERIRAKAVVIATGGLSVPATGSDGTGLALAQRLGHVVHETYPALTPLVARPHRFGDLSGISLAVTLEAPLGSGRRFVSSGGFLFTHKGYSGPSVLNLSHLCVAARKAGREQAVFVRWTPLGDKEWEEVLRGEGTALAAVRLRLPARLAESLFREAGVDPGTSLGQLRREERHRLITALTRFPLPWADDEGYTKAEVTGGGVSLAEIEPRTLESRRHSGLFLCGELLDAFGPIGGYNFAWAWSTGRAAGLGAAAAAMVSGPPALERP